MSISLRLVSSSDLDLVASHVRDADRMEWALQDGQRGRTMNVLIRESVARSDFAATAAYDGRAVALFGVSKLEGDSGCIWAIMAEDVENPRVHVPWIRFSRQKLMPILMNNFRKLGNIVHAKNTRAIRFLELLDFTILPHPIQSQGEDFYPFYLDSTKKFE